MPPWRERVGVEREGGGERENSIHVNAPLVSISVQKNKTNLILDKDENCCSHPNPE